MKTRLFLSFLLLTGLACLVYLVGWWAGYEYGRSGIVIPSRDLIAIAAVFLAIPLIWAIWNVEMKFSIRNRAKSQMNEEAEQVEKKKREHIDSVLRELSDEDLLRLRRRLLDGTINDDTLEEALVGEDGEMLYREQR